MNAFEITQIFTAQGADKGAMAQVLESLHSEQLLPAWGPGASGAELSTREVVSTILGSTAAQPKTAAQHCITIAGLIREDGASFGEVITRIIESEPYSIKVEEITVSADGQLSTIRYTGGSLDVFYVNGGQKAFRHACIVRGSVLQAIAMKLHFPTESGWKAK